MTRFKKEKETRDISWQKQKPNLKVYWGVNVLAVSFLLASEHVDENHVELVLVVFPQIND